MSYGPDAIAHDDEGKTVFVCGGAPGDVLRARITEAHERFDRAELIELIEPSELRVRAACALCGGCSWGHLSYEAQLQAKRANVVDSLVRVGHMESDLANRLVQACQASPETLAYRNKVELNAFPDSAGRLSLGMAQAASGDFVPVDCCPLARKPIAKAPKAIRGALRHALGANFGDLFRIGLRAGCNTEDLEIALWTEPGAFPRSQVAKVLQTAVPQATSIVRVIASKGKARTVKGVERLAGKGHWEEFLCPDGEEAWYQISAPSFFQVNTRQAEVLVSTALEGLGDIEGKHVADLYSGAGTFSIPLAFAGARVTAIESAKSSIRDLRRNAESNCVDIEAIGGDAEHELSSIGRLDALIVDPPRAGLAKGVVQDISNAKPSTVVYVSCDPATLARDLRQFGALGYHPAKITPVDLFPQTYHVENVALLSRQLR